VFTLPYGLFYIVGAGLGYAKTKNYFCLFISGFCGVLFMLLAIGHAIDYYRGVAVESYFVVIPFSEYVNHNPSCEPYIFVQQSRYLWL
jgi:hypothetical protein